MLGQEAFLRLHEGAAEAEQLGVGQVLTSQLGLDGPLLLNRLRLPGADADGGGSTAAHTQQLVRDLDPLADDPDARLGGEALGEDKALPDRPCGEGFRLRLVGGEAERRLDGLVLRRPIVGLERRAHEADERGEQEAVAPARGDEPAGRVGLRHAATEGAGDGDDDGDHDKNDRDGVTHGVILSCTSFEDGRLFVNLCHIDPMAVDATH